MNTFGFGQNFVRQIKCGAAFMVLLIATKAYALIYGIILNVQFLKYVPISKLIVKILGQNILWDRVILIFIYVTLLWNAKVRFGTINKCLR